MMEKRNLVQKDRTPKLNRQEELDTLEKKAVSLFDKPGEHRCTCVDPCAKCCKDK